MALQLWPALALAAAVVLVARALGPRLRRRRLPLPPGPPGEPVLGHLRVVPAYRAELAYQRWSREYGSDVIALSVLGQPVVVLNSNQAAMDLLDRRGANYVDRPRFVLFEVMGWHKTLTFLRPGPDFRLHRRVLQKAFQRSAIVQFQPLQLRETAIMLKGLLARPPDWEKVLRRFATSLITAVGFGFTIDGDTDPFVEIADGASYVISHGGTPAGTPVDFFPFLKSLPRCLHDRSLKFAADGRWIIRKFHELPYQTFLASDRRMPSVMRDMVDQRQRQLDRGEAAELSVDDVKGAGGAIFAAGTDTTWSALVVFLLNMMLHPDVQAKAQRALDDVVGRHRLPSFDDRPRLPYVEHVLQETLRWSPVSPLGVPHRSLEDDVYKGYYIPAGALVYANAWAITHDEAVYSDPDAFNPDRYTSADVGGLGEPLPNGHFGYGRRICVGKHLAEASLWIAMASMLSTLTILKAVDDDGNEIEPEVKLSCGLSSHPEKFPCRIMPRDERAVAVVQRAVV